MSYSALFSYFCFTIIHADVLFDVDHMENLNNWYSDGAFIGNKSCYSDNCVYIGQKNKYIQLKPISTLGYKNVCYLYIYYKNILKIKTRTYIILHTDYIIFWNIR